MNPEDDLITVAYVSSATHELTTDELGEILKVSRERNERDGLTGLLLYHDGNFIQVLEGPEGPVRAAVSRIQRDLRHNQFTVLLDQPIGVRAFAGWAMGFRHVHSISPEDGELYAAFRAGRLQDVGFLHNPVRTWHLIKTFAESMR
jgi:hypothetical protein